MLYISVYYICIFSFITAKVDIKFVKINKKKIRQNLLGKHPNLLHQLAMEQQKMNAILF